MSATTVIGSAARPAIRPWPLFWLAMLVVTIFLVAFRELLQPLFPQLYDYPRSWIIPLANWTTIFMREVVIAYFFTITRAFSELLSLPLQLSYALFDRGFTFGNGAEAVTIPPLSWVGVAATVAIIGHAYGGWRLALIGGLGFLYLALFGQWSSAMPTLAMIVISVPLGVVIGLLLGIIGYRRPRFNKAVLVPLLDIAQATPQYAYLVPILLLFGNNPVSAMIATLAFAVPPMVRVTTLALGQVPGEVQDFGNMAGCTRRQHLWRILVPSARPTLMVGVNQVINMTLNMVIIASMIGAGGLGFDVLTALRALKIGPALEAGIAIVVLAIVFDRISQAAAVQPPGMLVPGLPFWQRHPYILLALAALLSTTLLVSFVPWLGVLPRKATFSTGAIWQAAITWININFFDYIEAARVWLVLHILRPVKDFLLALPWIFVVALLGAAGYQLGRWRLALAVMLTTMFCAVTGLWDITMTTVYLVGSLQRHRRHNRHSPGHLGGAQRPRRSHPRGHRRHAADDPGFLLSHPGGHAAAGRRCGGDAGHRALCRGAGDPLHQSRHPPRLAASGRSRQGFGMHAPAAAVAHPAAVGPAGDHAGRQPGGVPGAVHGHHRSHGRHLGPGPGGVQGAVEG